MQIQKFSLKQTKQFSRLLTDYLTQKPELKPFYHYFPSIGNFKNQLLECDFSPEKRKTLHQALTEQYSKDKNIPKQAIDSFLDEKTFAVTTGHQLNIFSGPLYVIYKLVTAINLANTLKRQYPEYQFVPVYWMATEDHDFEEINHFDLFGKKYTWETGQKGAVGEMEVKEIEKIIGELPEKVALFEKAYLEKNTLAEATRCWANELFGKDGLVCLDASHAGLKSEFQSAMREDIFENSIIKLVKSDSEKLETAGYSPQVNGRDINFFYMEKGVRERIVQNENQYEVLNTSISFSKTELEKIIAENPEKLSPNVILRPVYQQVILPNLAYIGGPAEVAYWFQLKSVFEHLQVPFPILLPRNFALYINKSNAKKLEKLNISAEELFFEEIELKKNFIEKNTENPVDVKDEMQLLEKLFEDLVKKSLQTDPSLEGFIKAERQKSLSSLENIEKRLKKAEEQKQSTQINQLLGLKAKLFPGGGLQERNDNFLNFYLNNPDFLEILKETFDPLDFSFYIFTENE